MNYGLLGRSGLGAALVLTLSGCGGSLGSLGTIGDILGGLGGLGGAGGQQGQVTAEVQQVDTRQQIIQVRTEDGQSGAVRYDQNTAVIYQQQQYPVTALEPGDVIAMQIQQDANNNLYVSRIDVVQSVQERTGAGAATGQVQRISGRVGQVDTQRGLFQLQTQFGYLTVSLPYNPPPATVDRFRRLRNGDTVTIEGTPLGSDRFELHRFL